MEHIITELSKYLIILLMMLFTFQCFTIFRKHDLEDKYQVLRKQIVLMLFMNFVAYGVLYMKTKETNMILMCGAVFLFIIVVQILYRVIYRKGNLLIVNNMCMLLSIGFLILSRLNFDKAVKQFEIVVVGMVLSFVVPVDRAEGETFERSHLAVWNCRYHSAGTGFGYRSDFRRCKIIHRYRWCDVPVFGVGKDYVCILCSRYAPGRSEF